MDYKAFKKLVAFCRKNGISHFQNEEYEFTLSNIPSSTSKKRKKITPLSDTSSIEVQDTLTDDTILYWSVMDEGNEADENY